MVISNEKTVGELAAEVPGAARVFEKYHIDYCCGGNHAVGAVCRQRGIPLDAVLGELEQEVQAQPQPGVPEWSDLRELIHHILSRHHAYLRSELPRLAELFAKVVEAHGERQPVLFQVREIFLGLQEELDAHMMKEELILFPAIERLEAAAAAGVPAPCGPLEHPIERMEHEHEGAGRALAEMRDLTRDYNVPKEACNAYRALFAALVELESDLHQHIHLENNILFPRAQKLPVHRSLAATAGWRAG